MQKIVHLDLGANAYDVVIERGCRHNILPENPADSLLVTDSHVAELYPEIVKKFPHAVFPAGEASKTFATVESFCRQAALLHLDRRSCFYALGGGVCGDLTGFAAAIYMRGCRFVQIPTTLLAMVDSSVGGKTGADLPEGKNLIGAFLQPEKVWIDTEFLDTLAPAEIRCGMAEAVKTAVIMDAEFFRAIERSPEHPDFDFIAARSCECKSSIVTCDERENGVRALLNYGHTFGHAIEAESRFMISHGDAVALGMCAAGRLAVQLHLWSEADHLRQKELLEKLHLPVRLEPGAFDKRTLLERMRSDKKNRNGKIRLVLPCAIGSAKVFSDIPEERILNAYEELFS